MSNSRRAHVDTYKSTGYYIFYIVCAIICSLIIVLSIYGQGDMCNYVRMVSLGLFGVFSYFLLGLITIYSVLAIIQKIPAIDLKNKIFWSYISVMGFILAHTIYSCFTERFSEFEYYFNTESIPYSPGGGLLGILNGVLASAITLELSILFEAVLLVGPLVLYVSEIVRKRQAIYGNAKKINPKQFEKMGLPKEIPTVMGKSRLFIDDIVPEKKNTPYDGIGESRIMTHMKPEDLITPSDILGGSYVSPEANLHSESFSYEKRNQEKPVVKPEIRQEITPVVQPEVKQEAASGFSAVNEFDAPKDDYPDYPDDTDDTVSLKNIPEHNFIKPKDDIKSLNEIDSRTTIEDNTGKDDVIIPTLARKPKISDSKRPVYLFKDFSGISDDVSGNDAAREKVPAGFSPNLIEKKPNEKERSIVHLNDSLAYRNQGNRNEGKTDGGMQNGSALNKNNTFVSTFAKNGFESKGQGKAYSGGYSNPNAPKSFDDITLPKSDYSNGSARHYSGMNDEKDESFGTDSSKRGILNGLYDNPGNSGVESEDMFDKVSDNLSYDPQSGFSGDAEYEEPFKDVNEDIHTIGEGYDSLTILNNEPVDLTERSFDVTPENDNSGMYERFKPSSVSPDNRFSGRPGNNNSCNNVCNQGGNNFSMFDSGAGDEYDESDDVFDAEEFSKFPELSEPVESEPYIGPTASDFEYSQNIHEGMEEAEEKTVALENAIADLGYPAKVINIVVGPSVVRYELDHPKGIHIDKIQTMENDIQGALKANSCIIKAPIPGTDKVGIEASKDSSALVQAREFYEDPKFRESGHPLLIPMGYTVDGERVFADIPSMGHMLIAGATRMGKSVFINNLILSLVLKNSPEDLRLLLIDPKLVEFQAYSGLPHMITENALAYDEVNGVNVPLRGLRWVLNESLRRYELLKAAHNLDPNLVLRNIVDYNTCPQVLNKKWTKLPYIVVIIDEFNDLISYDRKETISIINRITCRAAACGIHVIVATQRPDRDTIDGKIKSNLNGRVAFKVQQRVNSGIILDEDGADKLCAKGEMLFKDNNGIQHLQGPFVSNDVVAKITNSLKKNNKCVFDEKAEQFIKTPDINMNSVLNVLKTGEQVPSEEAENPGDSDEKYFPDVMRLFINKNKASTSMVQTKMRFGYNKASRIVNTCEQNGWISDMSSSNTRQVYMTPEQFEEVFDQPFDQDEGI